jgi:hypothetical protein
MIPGSKPRVGEAVALGFRAHSGWTIAVAVAGSLDNPFVLERRRIETADPSIPGSRQPYHAAERLDVRKAENLIRLCREPPATEPGGHAPITRTHPRGGRRIFPRGAGLRERVLFVTRDKSQGARDLGKRRNVVSPRLDRS